MVAERGELLILGDSSLAGPLAHQALDAGHAVRGWGGAEVADWPVERARRGAWSDLAAALQQPATAGSRTVVLFGPHDVATAHQVAGPLREALERMDAAGVSRLVYWGAASVYGAPGEVRGRPLLEGDALRGADRHGGEAVALDERVQAMSMEMPGVEVYLFRAVPQLLRAAGWERGALGRLRLVPAPRQRSYLQFLDGRDALAVLLRAVRGGHPGVYNVAGDGIVRLGELLQARGCTEVRLPRPLQLAATYLAQATRKMPSAGALLRLTGGTVVIDNGRLKTHFGYRPRYDSRRALIEAEPPT